MKNIYYYFKYKEIIDFIKNNLEKPLSKNQWFHFKNFKIYIRTSNRIIENKKERTIDIATIEVDEKYQSRGILTKFLDEIENNFPNNIIFIESVVNPKLYTHLIKKRNYKELDYLPHCLYLKRSK